MKRRNYTQRSTWFFRLILLSGVSLLVFFSCGKDKYKAMGSPVPDSAYYQAGKQIVSATFDTLRKTLTREIATHGTEGAVSFCSERAAVITGTYGDSVIVRRTSLRYRNPNNQPDSLESKVLITASEEMAAGKLFKARLIRNSSNGDVHYFKPILMQSMCLNCHGKPGSQINPLALTRIGQLYPNDLAINYKENELRGLWHITFKPKEKPKTSSKD